MTDPRYPVGRFKTQDNATAAHRVGWVDQIESTPARLRDAVRGLTRSQLDTPYRDGGWTVRQVVHHVPDSHMQSYGRFRYALTEDAPLIKPYPEDRWAELEDARTAPPELSLALLDALHARWVILLRSLTEAEWGRTFRHPDLGEMDLGKTANLYAWHGRHHVGHVLALRDRMGWS
ncbi:MAG: bacillithiol transferase BstA [Acidobacteriota bacterium]|nr:bacillithiol transferase BstA [Acidobacteriota bacterium]